LFFVIRIRVIGFIPGVLVILIVLVLALFLFFLIGLRCVRSRRNSGGFRSSGIGLSLPGRHISRILRRNFLDVKILFLYFIEGVVRFDRKVYEIAQIQIIV